MKQGYRDALWACLFCLILATIYLTMIRPDIPKGWLAKPLPTRTDKETMASNQIIGKWTNSTLTFRFYDAGKYYLQEGADGVVSGSFVVYYIPNQEKTLVGLQPENGFNTNMRSMWLSFPATSEMILYDQHNSLLLHKASE